MSINVTKTSRPPVGSSSHEEEEVVALAIHPRSNLTRSVYCVLGIPVDAVDLTAVVHELELAVAEHRPLLISTPNLNFLTSSLSDQGFKDSLLESDLCPPDGAPIVLIARLLGLPIKERAAGADLLERLQSRGLDARPLTAFLFGGAEGIAEAAGKKLNARPSGLACVGTMNPGFCDVSEMSGHLVINEVNSSGADFLVVSLGAKKGQLWLQRNHRRLTTPVRAHLGAALNFQAGTIQRAPLLVRAWGFEWLWRIKEERYLWRRYRDDGLVLLRLLLTRVLPLAIITRWQQLGHNRGAKQLSIESFHETRSIVVALRGGASARHVPKAVSCFQEAISSNKDVVIDLSDTLQIDARFMGLLLMLRKELKSRGKTLGFAEVPPAIKRIFHLNELGFLLSERCAGSDKGSAQDGPGCFN